MYGLSDDTLDKIIKVILKCKHVEDIIIFGSRALGTFRNGSDIDLSLKGEISTNDLYQIMIELDDLSIPYEVDLNCYNRIDNEKLKDHIDRIGVSLM